MDNIDKKRMIIRRISGDITRVESDAIITAINSSGLWFGGIDGAIRSVAGDMYHGQVAQMLVQGELSDLKVVVATGDHSSHRGKFDNVVFVIDDLQSPLRQVITKGLEAADDAGFKKVAIPAIRTGVMIGVVEKNLRDVVHEYAAGIRDYVINKTINDKQDPIIQEIRFVTYNNPELEEILRRIIKE